MAKVVLGAEFDEALYARVQAALKELGAVRTSKSWGVAGSQELASEEWRVEPVKLLLDRETYMGLTLTGPDELLDQNARRLKTEP